MAIAGLVFMRGHRDREYLNEYLCEVFKIFKASERQIEYLEYLEYLYCI